MAKIYPYNDKIVIKVRYNEWTLENGYNFDLYIEKGLTEYELWEVIFNYPSIDINTEEIIGDEQVRVDQIIFLDKDNCYYLKFSGNSPLIMKYNPNTGMMTMHHGRIGD